MGMELTKVSHNQDTESDLIIETQQFTREFSEKMCNLMTTEQNWKYKNFFDQFFE